VPEAAADGGDSVDRGRLRFCAGALLGLGARSDLDVHAFAVSWRRRGEIGSRLPGGVRSEQHSMPARPLHSL